MQPRRSVAQWGLCRLAGRCWKNSLPATLSPFATKISSELIWWMRNIRAHAETFSTFPGFNVGSSTSTLRMSGLVSARRLVGARKATIAR